MTFSIEEIAEIIGSQSVTDGTAGLAEAIVSLWSIDSRTIEPGALYIALRGERHDGHGFLRQAFEKGAKAAIVEDRAGLPLATADAVPLLLRVPDTLASLQTLATEARRRLDVPVIGVTGSAGKTSTKDAIAELLSTRFRTGRNEGNLNNHIGLPLSILRLQEDVQAAVLEMGMNHAGEIRELAGIARPGIGVVTNVGAAHIENFGSLEGIAAAKRELIEALPSDGVAVLNADDEFVRNFGAAHAGRTITYGTAADAQIRATDVEFTLWGSTFRIDGVPFEISLPGRHGILNVTAGVAVGSLLGIGLEELAGAARHLRAGKMRGERMEHRGTTILNDCYNSNPQAAKSMLDVLDAMPGTRRIAVLGEMLELGDWSERLHREVGRYAAEHGIDSLIGIRGAAAQMVEEARNAGVRGETLFFEQPEEAGEAVSRMARPGDVILFKGSRGTKVEKALERYLAS